MICATFLVDTSSKINLLGFDLEVFPTCHVGSSVTGPDIWETKRSSGLELCPQSARLMHFKTAVYKS